MTSTSGDIVLSSINETTSNHPSNYSKSLSLLSIENSESYDNCNLNNCENGENCAKKNLIKNITVKLLFSTPGLVVLVIFYSIFGAFIFPLLEVPMKNQNIVSISKSREDCLRELWIITERLNVLYERNWTKLVHEQLKRFEGTIVAATKNGLIHMSGNDKSSEINEIENYNLPRWTFSEALLYSVTVITTIGHGNLTPQTSEGKIVTMLYALIGVPLMLMCLSNLGGLLAEALQCAYGRLCQKNYRKKRKRKKSLRENGKDINNCGDSSEEDDNNEISCHENCQQFNERECNLCKYDPIHLNDNKEHTYRKYTSINGCDTDDSYNLILNKNQTTSSTSPKNSSKNQTNSGSTIATAVTKTTTTSAAGSAPLSSSTINMYNVQTMGEDSGFGIGKSFIKLSPKHYPNPITTTTNISIDNEGCVGCDLKYTAATATPQNTINKTLGYYQPITISSTTVSSGGCSGSVVVPTNCSRNLINQDNVNVKYHNSKQYNQQIIPGQAKSYQTVQFQLNENEKNNHFVLYHTASVHGQQGMNRSKFIPKPLPQEINALLAECDLGKSSTKCGGGTSESDEHDEDDDDESQIVCNHDTPSRKPLITSKQSDPSRSTNTQVHLQNKLPQKKNQTKNFINKDNNKITESKETVSSINSLSSYPQVPITIILLILLSYIGLGTIIFSIWENWSIIDGAYFCFITLSTIGFGSDLVPKKTFRGNSQIQFYACCAYLLLGLILVAMSFSLLETQLIFKCKRIAVRLKLTKD